jgi:hypothetical protein
MKALGFFAVVFLSMLGFFVVATGEFERWISDDEKAASGIEVRISRNRGNGAEGGQNILDFDFWNVELGRRNFTLRAELPAADLKNGARIDELERIQLANGTIQVPLYSGKKLAPSPEGFANEDELKELILEFETATYFRSGGLAKGGREIAVVLRNGKGSTNEGTEFHFEELLFTNVTGDKSTNSDSNRFIFQSDNPVSIVNRYLEVHSPTGLRGEIGQKGIERVNFLPPVRTYLDPEVIGDFALGADTPKTAVEVESKDGSAEPKPGAATPSKKEPRRRAVILCDGALELAFRDADANATSQDGSAAKKGSPTRITFRDNVVVYNAEVTPGAVEPPKPSGNRFECQELLLEIDDAGKRPLPRRALATWEGGQVRTLIVRGGKTYVLAGDRLEWINLDPGAAADSQKLLSEGYLTGNPTLRGPDVEFGAHRAVLRPDDDTVILEKVQGTFRRERRKEDRLRQGEGRAKAVVRSSLAAAGDGGSEGAQPDVENTETTPKEVVEFSAPRVDVFFAPDPETGQKGLSRFVASGDGPRDVVIRSRGPASLTTGAEKTEPRGAGPKSTRPKSADQRVGVRPFQASGRTLTFDAAKHQVTLEGTADELPRLTQGESWIEARSIHLLVEAGPQAAWFEDQVKARIDLGDFARESDEESDPAREDKKGRNEKKDPKEDEPRVLSIDADYLGLAFSDGRELKTALARGDLERPVRLETLSGTKYVFFAREVRLENDEKVIELFSGDVGPDGLARMEMPGGSVRARHIRFEQEKRLATLEGAVELRLTDRDESSGGDEKKESKESPDVDLVVRAATANVELLDRKSRVDSEKSGIGALAGLSDVKSLVAQGSEEEPLIVETSSFRLNGENLEWDAESRRLVFRGSGLQEVLVKSDELRGPVRAREIIFDQTRGVVVLQTAVRGELRQAPRPVKTRRAKAAGTTKATRDDSQAMVWEFETNALEIHLREAAEGRRFEVSSIVARDKVLLYSRNQAVLLRGDDLVYDSARQRVEVFSRDGRRQTLQHFKSLDDQTRGLDDVKAAGAVDPEGPVDTIHAQRIFASLEENANAGTPRGRPRQMLLVQFRKDVLANFYMPGSSGLESSGGASVGRAGKHWQLIAQRLTLHVDPAATAKGPRAVPWALATGSAEGAHRNVTINTGPYQAFAERAELQAPARQLVLSGSKAFPVTIADRRPGRSGTIDQEKHAVVVIRKVGDEIIIDSPRRAPTTEPWPGVPDWLDD